MRSVQRALLSAAGAAAVLGTAAGVTAAASAAPARTGAHPVARTGGRTPAGIGVKATIKVGNMPFGAAADPATGAVYVSNTFGTGRIKNEGTVSVLNGSAGQLTGTVPVQSAPFGVAVNPRTDTIYVANANGKSAAGNPRHGSVSVISGQTGQVTATIRAGDLPFGVAVDPVTDRVYVTNSNGNSVSVIVVRPAR